MFRSAENVDTIIEMLKYRLTTDSSRIDDIDSADDEKVDIFNLDSLESIVFIKKKNYKIPIPFFLMMFNELHAAFSAFQSGAELN